ncbi:ArdC family protein [Rubrivirga litoralis]|uniref:ArdC family protein n=1 Tax=Rubrivirga litoralis TaxID=3075598 RepID=A0ABU3BUF4_9BACT|nr:ArdC family protein [Rubrivirga sp. F394]MDT0632928.1 ArdC family protein [Rubrivirga sp. F394]
MLRPLPAIAPITARPALDLGRPYGSPFAPLRRPRRPTPPTMPKATRTKPTAKQTEQAQQRRDEAAATLAAGVEHVAQDPEALAAYLEFRANFRRYSCRNALFLSAQARTRGASARHFMGFRAWQGHGRQVQKGQRGYKVFAPTLRKLTAEECAARGREEGARTVSGFRLATVFDIDQTEAIEGREAEALVYASPIPELTGDDFEHVAADLVAVAQAIGYTVGTYAAHVRTAGGVCDAARREIGVKEGPADRRASTLAHEVVHALAHDGADARGIGKAAREIQAEGAAYLACYVLGLDTSTASLPYLRSWATGDTPEERAASVQAQLGAIDALGWRLVELVEAHRSGTLTADVARGAVAASATDADGVPRTAHADRPPVSSH